MRKFSREVRVETNAGFQSTFKTLYHPPINVTKNDRLMFKPGMARAVKERWVWLARLGGWTEEQTVTVTFEGAD